MAVPDISSRTETKRFGMTGRADPGTHPSQKVLRRPRDGVGASVLPLLRSGPLQRIRVRPPTERRVQGRVWAKKSRTGRLLKEWKNAEHGPFGGLGFLDTLQIPTRTIQEVPLNSLRGTGGVQKTTGLGFGPGQGLFGPEVDVAGPGPGPALNWKGDPMDKVEYLLNPYGSTYL